MAKLPIPLIFLILLQIPANLAQQHKDELLLVQAVWRHGDRSPTDTFPNDPNKEDKWPQGWGQLTPKGMGQHVVLGDKLAKKYIRELGLLSPQYKSAEIYVRSTDLNRTLTSAVSNMIGFYHAGVPGQDFPDRADPAPFWPTQFTPVAIHTVATNGDHILPDVPDVPCPRQDKLQKMVRQTPEYKKMMEEKKWLFDELKELSGEKIDIFNFWVIADTLFIEDIYEKEYSLNMPAWTKNETLRNEIQKMNFLFEDWTEGKGLEPMNGVKFAEELPRVRGGPMLWILLGNMQTKLECAQPEEKRRKALVKAMSPVGSLLCHWMGRKKYFAYSAHDTTISALFATLGFEKTNFDQDGFPHYSACVTVELWRNAISNEPYVKVFYWPPDEDGKKRGAEEVTYNITGCATGCTFQQFLERSKLYEPVPSADAYCQNTYFPPSTADSAQSLLTWPLAIFMPLFLAICLR